MNTKLELHHQKRKIERHDDGPVDGQGNDAKPNMIENPLAEDMKLDNFGDRLGMISSGKRTDIDVECTLDAHNGPKVGPSVLEDATGHRTHDDQESNYQLSEDNPILNLPQPNRRKSGPIPHQTDSRAVSPPLSERTAVISTAQLPTRQAEAFIGLLNAILRFLVAFSMQESSPFKASLDRVQDQESDGGFLPDSCETTTDTDGLDRRSTPDQSGTPDALCTASSDLAPAPMADQKPISKDEEWEPCRFRISNMVMRLIQWKNEFSEDSLPSFLSGTSTVVTVVERAVKSQLLRIGKRLSNSKEAQLGSQIPDDMSLSTSGNKIISTAESIRATNQQIDELSRDISSLIDIGAPNLVKKPSPRPRARPLRKRVGKMPVFDPLKPSPPEPSHIRSPPFPNPEDTVWNTSISRKKRVRRAEDTRHWTSTQKNLQWLQRRWRRMRPSPEIESQLKCDKPVQLTLLISSDPTAFQPDKFQSALASFEQSQRERTDSLKELADLFSTFQVQLVDNQLCTNIVETFRDAVPKVHHKLVVEESGTPSPLLPPIESIDFTLAILENLPHWVLYTNFPDGKKAARVLASSVQTVLLDEFWESCTTLLCQLRDPPRSLNRNTGFILSRQRYVQALLLQRLESLNSLRVSCALASAWDILLPKMPCHTLHFSKSGGAIQPADASITAARFDIAYAAGRQARVRTRAFDKPNGCGRKLNKRPWYKA
ncbi:hypothetical protein ONZ43_g3240 [Nemania bipapillata]|uniref:Uncharacterized protein n=1 Tax=Nemania bipapillata TaxID=110536 RepID=A0ACC2IXT5_9PEZI|nr:hypothetical protein ONZ43_g3240 [Nemania bipapillata]